MNSSLYQCAGLTSYHPVAQVSQPVVSPISNRLNVKSSKRIEISGYAGFETCDTADLEICATSTAARRGWFLQIRFSFQKPILPRLHFCQHKGISPAHLSRSKGARRSRRSTGEAKGAFGKSERSTLNRIHAVARGAHASRVPSWSSRPRLQNTNFSFTVWHGKNGGWKYSARRRIPHAGGVCSPFPLHGFG